MSLRAVPKRNFEADSNFDVGTDISQNVLKKPLSAMASCSCSYSLASEARQLKKLGGCTALRRAPGWQRRDCKRQIKALVGPEHWQDVFAPLLDHAILAYERVVFPCQSMNCGDAVYRR